MVTVSQGEIFFIDFNPSRGHEQRSYRPAIALSNDLVAEKSNMTIVAPISSTKRDFPMYYKLNSTKKIHGKVMLDQTIALDLIARKITANDIKEKVSKQELTDILYHYQLLFSIDSDY